MKHIGDVQLLADNLIINIVLSCLFVKYYIDISSILCYILYMIDTQEKFIRAVENMRKCQKALKKMYTEANKKAAADAEKIVDCAIIEHRKKLEESLNNKQKDLFD